jgi:pimeloyl-ACP methyl ester carboxylesterase
MDLAEGMAATVAHEMPTPAEIAACTWLPEDELAFYAATYAATGFQGGLHWYRCRTGPWNADLEVFAGRTVDVPSCFIGGASDWGVYQTPGAFEKMQTGVCTDMRLVELLDGAGHWVQQEQPEAVTRLLLRFLSSR